MKCVKHQKMSKIVRSRIKRGLKPCLYLCIIAIIVQCSNSNKNNIDRKIKSASTNVVKFKNTAISTPLRKQILMKNINGIKFSYFVECYGDSFRLVVETFCINDTLITQDAANEISRSPIIVDQKLSFYKNDEVLRSFFLPFHRIDKASISGDVYSVPDIYINYIGYVEGRVGTLYFIVGSSLCAAGCLEYFNYFSLSGEKLLSNGYLYPNEPEDNEMEIIERKYGIDKEMLGEANMNNTVDVTYFW